MVILTSFRIIRRAVVMFGKNKGAQNGAALAYYALFSVAPLLLIAIAITGAFFGEEAARASAVQSLETVLEPDTARTLMGLIENSLQPREGVWGPFLVGGLLLFGALKIFFHIRMTFCDIWDIAPPKGSGFLGIVLGCALAVVMVVVVVLLLVGLVLVELVLTTASRELQQRVPFLDLRGQLVGIGLAYLFLVALLSMIYRVLSGGQIQWRHVIYGAGIAAVLFSVGKVLLSLYFGLTDLHTVYGAGGSIVVFLIWINYSAQITIFGAELIQARRTRDQWMSRG